MKLGFAVAALAIVTATLPAQDQNAARLAREALIARGKSLDLGTPYVSVPGDRLQHEAAGYATVLCSAMFISGLDSAFVAENTGYFTAPYESRALFKTVKIDRANRSVSVTMPNGTVRLAKRLGSQGCIALPIGKTEPEFKPVVVKSALPPAASIRNNCPSGSA